MSGDPCRSGNRRRLHQPRQPGRRGLERLGRARPRQYRPARRQAGDGRQGGAVQEIRRHRRLRHRDRRARDRPHGRDDFGARADLRRHQPRRHQGAGMFRGRGAVEGADGHSGLPRRPARHGDHRGGRGAQRARARRQGDRRRQDRHVRRRRRRACLPQPAGLARRQAREHLGHRPLRRRLQGPRRRDGPLEGSYTSRTPRRARLPT